jgi:nucleotide-binding universal stress UspA family protein
MLTHLARQSERFVYLWCVIPEDVPDIRQLADDALRGVAHNWLEGKTPYQTIVRVGKPAAEIVKLEEELDVDLVVMATHGRKGEKYDKLGSVTEQVVRDSTRPVLTIRPT